MCLFYAPKAVYKCSLLLVRDQILVAQGEPPGEEVKENDAAEKTEKHGMIKKRHYDR